MTAIEKAHGLGQGTLNTQHNRNRFGPILEGWAMMQNAWDASPEIPAYSSGPQVQVDGPGQNPSTSGRHSPSPSLKHPWNPELTREALSQMQRLQLPVPDWQALNALTDPCTSSVHCVLAGYVIEKYQISDANLPSVPLKGCYCEKMGIKPLCRRSSTLTTSPVEENAAMPRPHTYMSQMLNQPGAKHWESFDGGRTWTVRDGM